MWFPMPLPACDRLLDAMRNEWLSDLGSGYQPLSRETYTFASVLCPVGTCCGWRFNGLFQSVLDTNHEKHLYISLVIFVSSFLTQQCRTLMYHLWYLGISYKTNIALLRNFIIYIYTFSSLSKRDLMTNRITPIVPANNNKLKCFPLCLISYHSYLLHDLNYHKTWWNTDW